MPAKPVVKTTTQIMTAIEENFNSYRDGLITDIDFLEMTFSLVKARMEDERELLESRLEQLNNVNQLK